MDYVRVLDAVIGTREYVTSVLVWAGAVWIGVLSLGQYSDSRVEFFV